MLREFSDEEMRAIIVILRFRIGAIDRGEISAPRLDEDERQEYEAAARAVGLREVRR